MSLKQPIEVRSVKTGMFTVHTALARDVATAELFNVPRSVHVVNNVAKAISVAHASVDIRNINRALREPQEPEPELTAASAALASTR